MIDYTKNIIAIKPALITHYLIESMYIKEGIPIPYDNQQDILKWMAEVLIHFINQIKSQGIEKDKVDDNYYRQWKSITY